MSAVCGWTGDEIRTVVETMLHIVAYRGTRVVSVTRTGITIGCRCWEHEQENCVYQNDHALAVCAGSLVPAVDESARHLYELVTCDKPNFHTLDGVFTGIVWEGEKKKLTLLCDPFGIHCLYYVQHRGNFYFASEIKQLLAIPDLPIELDYEVLHKYLTFSFVPGTAMPISGIRRIEPGHVAIWQDGVVSSNPYFSLEETIRPEWEDESTALAHIHGKFRDAIVARLAKARDVGVYLSGGIDSSTITVFLAQQNISVTAFTLDFGKYSVEKEEAKTVARYLGLPLVFVKVGGRQLRSIFWDMVWKLDLPFGDAVTGPQYLLGQAAHRSGLSRVFNGEGGDQLFGGWTNKPMIAAELYGDLYHCQNRQEAYLHSYHRFYGLENELYTPQFRSRLLVRDERTGLIHRHLSHATTFLNQVRMVDIGLKGSQNILPRAERMAGVWGLTVCMPFFDRKLAQDSFSLPPQLKLQGACEKYIIKALMKKYLPEDIVCRRKSGMCVPVTDWVFGPMKSLMREILNPRCIASRGFFEAEYVRKLCKEDVQPGEIRRRRIGEKIWTLLMLEAWLRIFVDGHGKHPGG